MRNITKKMKTKFSLVIIAGVFALSVSIPSSAWAYRKSSGGADVEKFDAGTFAMGTAIGIASSVAGSAISSGVGSAFSANSGGFSAIGSLGGWVGSYGNTVASGQIGRAVSAVGNYYGLGGQAITGLSSLATGIGSGLISGNAGAIPESIVKSGILYAASNSKGEYSPWIGVAAGMAGDFAGGAVSNAALGDLVQGIPSHMVGVVAGEMTKGKGMMDRYVINQAFSGAYTAAGSLGKVAANQGLDLRTSGNIGSGGVKTTNSPGEYEHDQDRWSDPNDFNWLGIRKSDSGPTGKGDTNATIRLPDSAGPFITTYPEDFKEGPAPVDKGKAAPVIILSPQLPSANDVPVMKTAEKESVPVVTKAEWDAFVNRPTTGSVAGDVARSYAPAYLQDLYKGQASPAAAVSSTPVWQTPAWQYSNYINNGASPADAAKWSGYSPATQLTQPVATVPQLTTSFLGPVESGVTGQELQRIKPVELAANAEHPENVDLIMPQEGAPLTPDNYDNKLNTYVQNMGGSWSSGVVNGETGKPIATFKSPEWSMGTPDSSSKLVPPPVVTSPESDKALPNYKAESESLPGLPEETNIQTNRSLPASIIRPLPATTTKIEPKKPATAELLPNLDSLPKPETSMFQPVAPIVSETPAAEVSNVQQENPADIDLVAPPQGVPLVFDPNMNAPIAAQIKVGDRVYDPVSLDTSEAMPLSDGSTAEHLTSTEFAKQKQAEADLGKGIITDKKYDSMKSSGIVYVSSELTEDITQTRDRLSEELGKPVQAIITSGYRSPEYANYLMQRGNGSVATDSKHSVTANLPDGSEVRVMDAADVKYVTVEADGSNTPVPLETVYGTANDVVGSRGEIGLYGDGHIHMGLSDPNIPEDSRPIRWQTGVDIIPEENINNPHQYSQSFAAVAGAHSDTAIDAVKYRETGRGSGRATVKTLADIGATLNLTEGTKSKGPLQMRIGDDSVIQNYLLANKDMLGITDEQARSKEYQKQVAESPTQSRAAYKWLIGSLAENWHNTFSAIGYPNASVSEDQLVPVAYTTNMSPNTIKDRVLLWSVYNAAVNEGVIPAGTKVKAGEMEPIFEALAARLDTSPEDGFVNRAVLRGDKTFTVMLSEDAAPVTISNPGKKTLSECLADKGIAQLPTQLLISGYGFRENEKLVLAEDGQYMKRDFVGFMKSPTGRQVIDSIGGPDNILPTASDIGERDPGFLGTLGRGLYVYQTVNQKLWNESNASAAGAISTTGSSINVAPTLYQFQSGSYVNAPAVSVPTDMKSLPVKTPIATTPKASEIKRATTVSATVAQ